MSNITKIKIDNERERSYQDFPANREFKKRAEDDNPGGGWPSDLPKPSNGGYGYTENETIHKIDEKYLPESGRWPSDLHLPSDGGYGYEESGEQKTVVTFSGTGDFIYIDGSAYNNPPIDWEVGDVLTITINGTIYKVPMRSDPMDQEGDEGMVGWDAGAPRNPNDYWDIDWSNYDFLLHISWYYGEFDGGYVTIKDGEGTYDISATVGGDTIHKIDKKYLPEAGGYDELSGGNITEVDGKKYLTPLGGGAIRNPLDVEIVMTATEDGEITRGEEPIAEGELIVGETYQVTVNGVTDDYVCYVDEYDQKIVGTFEDDMTVGDWQIVSYDGGIYCSVCGNVNDEFHLEINGTKELVLQVDPAYFDRFVAVKFLVEAADNLTWRIVDIHGNPVKNKDLSDGDYIHFVGSYVGHEGIGRFDDFYRKMEFVFLGGIRTSTGATGLIAYEVHVLDGDDEAFAGVEVNKFYSAIEWSVQ